MKRSSFPTRHLAWGLLASVAMVGCDAGSTLTSPDGSTSSMPHDIAPTQTPVEIHSIYSGPPPWTSGVISLEDEFVFVEIFDVEEFLGRPASADDVRIGDDFETGTPAMAFEILDINEDGNRDIRLQWDLQQLADDGHLPPGAVELEVWGRDQTTGEEFMGSAEVLVGDPEGRTLTTTTANNTSGGVFMDYTPERPLRLLSFETPFTGTAGSTVDVEVWTRPGSYVGFDGTPEGWTLTQTVTVTRMGSAVNAMIVLDTPIALDAQATTAVYLQATESGGLRYNGTMANPPQTTWSNDDLTMFSDVARVATVAFEGTRFTPRTFAGNVNYEVIE